MYGILEDDKYNGEKQSKQVAWRSWGQELLFYLGSGKETLKRWYLNRSLKGEGEMHVCGCVGVGVGMGVGVGVYMGRILGKGKKQVQSKPRSSHVRLA